MKKNLFLLVRFAAILCLAWLYADTGAAQDTGTLQVTIKPDAVVSAGAKWGVFLPGDITDSYYDSGAVVTVPTGVYNISFNFVSGWTTPAPQSVLLSAGEAFTTTGVYVSNPTPVDAVLTAPANGSTLSSTATFTWTAGTAVSGYRLAIGHVAGGSDIYDSGTITTLSQTVTTSRRTELHWPWSSGRS